MRTDAEILALVERAFSNCPRPVHFTDHNHCCECAEHDAVLSSRDRTTLQLEDLGHPGWDPICFTTQAGFLHLLPALARVSLERRRKPTPWYGEQLIIHLNDDRRLEATTVAQCSAVVKLLEHLASTRTNLMDSMTARDLRHTIRRWSGRLGD